MTRTLVFAIAAAAALSACSQGNVAKCSKNSDCPKDAICVTGICQKGVPSGGNVVGTASGAGHLSAGTVTMDVTLGAPVTPGGTAGTKKMAPADNTR